MSDDRARGGLDSAESLDRGRWQAVRRISAVLVFGMSTWFSASAVIPQLETTWSLTPTTKAWLTCPPLPHLYPLQT